MENWDIIEGPGSSILGDESYLNVSQFFAGLFSRHSWNVNAFGQHDCQIKEKEYHFVFQHNFVCGKKNIKII
jgi:hypothetical protein